MNIDGIIFDLDGTLWKATDTVLKAWNDALRCEKEVKDPITKEQMEGIMGLQLPQIGERFFPYLEPEVRMEIMRKCCSAEREVLRYEGGELYPYLEDTLIKLSNKHKLFIVSNCECGYIEAFLEYHKLQKYFTDFECSGHTGLSKGENIKRIIERNGLLNSVYVGDTQGDCDGASVAGIPFVYASYGFGEVENYDYRIESIGDLVKNILV